MERGVIRCDHTQIKLLPSGKTWIRFRTGSEEQARSVVETHWLAPSLLRGFGLRHNRKAVWNYLMAPVEKNSVCDLFRRKNAVGRSLTSYLT
jgi:hypothetical protein